MSLFFLRTRRNWQVISEGAGAMTMLFLFTIITKEIKQLLIDEKWSLTTVAKELKTKRKQQAHKTFFAEWKRLPFGSFFKR